MDELVSVIVPIYNVRRYITRCVASLVEQTYTNLQIILVDDGSTDGSGDLCRAIAERDERIELIVQANGGVSSARNTGLSRVRGSWVAFVDSDDYISLHYIEDMLAAAQEGCDIVVCHGAWVSDDAEEAAPFRRHTHTQSITGRDACLRNLVRDTPLFITCWGKLYRAHLWSKLRFPAMGEGEDLFVSHALYFNAGNVVVTDAHLYAYVQSDGSIRRKVFTTQRLDPLDAWEEGVRFYDSVGDAGLANVARRIYCGRVFNARCICKKFIPHEREALRQLRQRALDAYRELKPIRGYIDCSLRRALAYRLKFFIGRWCLPLYSVLFVRGRTYI